MFTRVRLTNFKAWRDSGDVALKPITLLLGTNSSGKSSLVQSLLLLKQTAQSGGQYLRLKANDDHEDLLDFGNFSDVLWEGSEESGRISVSLDFTLPGPQHRAGITDAAAPAPSGSFTAVCGLSADGIVILHALQLACAGRRFRVSRHQNEEYSLFVDDEAKERGRGRAYAPASSLEFSDSALELLGRDRSFVESISTSLRSALANLDYLGPLRHVWQRGHVAATSGVSGIGADGRRAVDMLLSQHTPEGGGQGLINEVSAWISRMGLADRIEIRSEASAPAASAASAGRHELLVHRDGVQSNIRDVGYGVSQVLPVLVLACAAASGSTLILEEPEIHLHPLAQSVLAELFVEASQQRGLQFLIETHSEHMFRRLQTLMARSVIGPDDVAMHFVRRSGNESVLSQLDVDEYGAVHNWPVNFFGDSLGELRSQARARMERQSGIDHG